MLLVAGGSFLAARFFVMAAVTLTRGPDLRSMTQLAAGTGCYVVSLWSARQIVRRAPGLGYPVGVVALLPATVVSTILTVLLFAVRVSLYGFTYRVPLVLVVAWVSSAGNVAMLWPSLRQGFSRDQDEHHAAPRRGMTAAVWISSAAILAGLGLMVLPG